MSSSRYRRVGHAGCLLCCIAVFSLVLLTGCGGTSQRSKSIAPGSEWGVFEGTWTAVGARNTMHLNGNRKASISTFDGSLVLAGRSRPGVGFRSDAIVFNDTATGLVGRAVWTDQRGDHVFSELRGERTSSSNKITGTFVGGTGRYAGATGTYEFSWRFVIESEDGVVQGQSVGLKGRVLVNPQQTRLFEGDPQS